MDEPPSSVLVSLFSVLALMSFFISSFFAACRSSFNISDKQNMPLFDEPSLRTARRALFNLIRRPTRLAVALSVGENGGMALTVAFVAAAFIIHYEPLSIIESVFVVLIAFAVLLLVYIIGKTALMHYLGTPDFIYVWSSLLSFFIYLLYPLVLVIEKLVFLIEKPEDYLKRVGSTELDFWRGRSANEDNLENEEREMIRSIYEFGETTAREIMTPRTVMVAIDVNTPAQDVVEFFARSRFSRIPLYETTLDSIIGVIHVKNVLSAVARDGIDNLQLKHLATEPFYVPETKKLDELLQEIRSVRKQLVIVLDEYGGVSGLVTLEDILEEIVGEIQDEYDEDTKPIIPLKSGAYLLSARVPIEEMNETLNISTDDEDFDTLGGLVFSMLGRIPAKGDHFLFEGWNFTVVAMDGKRISMVRADPTGMLQANLERTHAGNGHKQNGSSSSSRTRENGVGK